MQSLRMSASTSARPQQTMGDIPDQTEAEIMIGPHREASRLPTVKDAIAMTHQHEDRYKSHPHFNRSWKQRVTRTLSSTGRQELMKLTHLPHLTIMMQMVEM